MSARSELSRLLSRSGSPSRVLPLDGPSLAVVLSRRESDVVVNFWARGCPARGVLLPSIERLSDERPDLTVVTVNVDRAARAADRHGVEQVPTVIRFRDGERVATAVGGLSYDGLLERLDLEPAPAGEAHRS